MPRTPAPRRSGLALAVIALPTLALAACGTDRTGATAAGKRPADAVGARPAGAPPATDPQVAFMELLNTVGEPCFPHPPTGPEPSAPTEQPRTAPVPVQLPVDPAPPTEAAPASTPTGAPPAAELTPAEQCAARRHAERITKALGTLPDPTPAQVRAALRGLGYLDERIHGPERSGAVARFFLDLRLMDSPLCLKGTVRDGKTVIETYGVPANEPFRPM
ncbi:hypothetical protein C3489_24460 [Streptomyces sp. Ru71]|uniref:hypothetical protein n=1 Tax=Streptomyces sp. Ru71 TaxID=2080746 RepID=UPI000CDD2D8F|nr:hypothetical protein [Streptomyces sp. Ru71]POX49503.1 hypothetical protein C3489_24460 [Streptomyces sp. Ru71]